MSYLYFFFGMLYLYLYLNLYLYLYEIPASFLGWAMTLGGTEAFFVQLGIAPLAAIMLCGILFWTVLWYERKHKEIQENKRKYKFNLGKSPPQKKEEEKKRFYLGQLTQMCVV